MSRTTQKDRPAKPAYYPKSARSRKACCEQLALISTGAGVAHLEKLAPCGEQYQIAVRDCLKPLTMAAAKKLAAAIVRMGKAKTRTEWLKAVAVFAPSKTGVRVLGVETPAGKVKAMARTKAKCGAVVAKK